MPVRNYYDTYIRDSVVEHNVFRRATPEDTPLPSFEQAKSELPSPAWEGHDSVVRCYWRAWEIAFTNLRRPTPSNGFVSNYIDTAFNDNLFMWDSSFIMFFGQYGARAFPFIRTLDNLYAKQHPDGFICREIRESDGSDCFAPHNPSGTGPNVLPWAEWHHFETTGDRDRLARVFIPLLAFHRWFRYNRSWPDGTYYATGWGSGMDNQPRLEAADFPEFRHDFMSWIDTTFQALYSADLLLKMAATLGSDLDISDLMLERERLSAHVNRYMWDEASGFYYDRRRDGALSGIKTIGAYWGLLAGAVPPSRRERFIGHLRDPRAFQRPHRVPTLAMGHPLYAEFGDYWCGAVWPPTNYMLLSGLTRVNEDALAHEIAMNHVDAVTRVFEKTNTVWENYAPERIEPGKPAKPDFVGWSGLPPIAVLFEYVFGLRPDAARGVLVWDVRLCDAFAVERYPFGSNGLLDLRCAARSSPSVRPEVVIRSNRPLSVELVWQAGRETIRVG